MQLNTDSHFNYALFTMEFRSTSGEEEDDAGEMSSDTADRGATGRGFCLRGFTCCFFQMLGAAALRHKERDPLAGV